jgi:phage host-nuclease inhibitor protein Gam
LFTGVARTYGNKQARKMRDDHKKEFAEASKKNVQNRKTKLSEISNEIKQLDQFIDDNKNFVENNILPTLKFVHSNINKYNNEIKD